MRRYQLKKSTNAKLESVAVEDPEHAQTAPAPPARRAAAHARPKYPAVPSASLTACAKDTFAFKCYTLVCKVGLAVKGCQLMQASRVITGQYLACSGVEVQCGMKWKYPGKVGTSTSTLYASTVLE